MERGYVKLWRKTLDTGLLKNRKLWAFWGYCLMKASYKKHTHLVGFKSVEINPGQFVFGRKKAATELSMSEQNIRTCINSLKIAGKLTIKVTNKFSIISIVNWDIYQQEDQQSNQQSNQHVTSSQPASNHKQEQKNNTAFGNAVTAKNKNEPFYLTKKKRKLKGKRLEAFEEFWNCFDYKKDKASAADSWIEIPSLTDTLVSTICKSAKLEAQKRPATIKNGQTPKWAQGWLASRRWEDEEYQQPETKKIYLPHLATE